MNYIFFTLYPHGTSSVSYKQWVFSAYLGQWEVQYWQVCRKHMLSFHYELVLRGIEYRIMIMNFCDVKRYRRKNKPTSFLFPISSKDPDSGKDWGQAEKGATEDEMAGWHHRLDGNESEWTPGDGDGQGGLACCDSWGCKESDTTERLNWLTDVSSNGQTCIPLLMLYC